MKCNMNRFTEQFVWAIAALSSLVTLLAFIFQSNIDLTATPIFAKIIASVLILAACASYACWMSRQKTRLSLVFNPNFKLIIEKGDLFEKSGIIVIPVNEYFDTHVGDGIISPTSVHGLFINKIFKDRVNELDILIDTKLSGIQPTGECSVITLGKNIKYELGTCINIEENGNVYVLVALTHFDNYNHAYLEKKDYPIVIDKLMDNLQKISMHPEKAIYMPLMGTGLSRLKRSPQRVLNFLIDAIDFKYSDKTFPNGIHIEIYNINQVNLIQLEELFKNDLSL